MKEVVDDIDDVVKDMEMEIEVSVIGADQLRESRPLLPVDRRHQDQGSAPFECDRPFAFHTSLE